MTKLTKLMLTLILLAWISEGVCAQQPQTQTAPIYAANSKYVQGVGPGYWPQAGSGLTLNLSAGRSRCTNTMVNYAGGTLAMTDNTTNYVYLNVVSACVPASNTTGYTSGIIAIATVVTSSGVITTITDDRTFGISTPMGGPGTGVSTTGSPAASNMACFSSATQITNCNLTGDVTTSGSSLTTLANIPTGTPMAGSLLATNIAAPSSPASGKNSLFSDSTDLRFHDKNAAGSIGTTVVADAGAANNFMTAISVAGAISKARPTCANLSDSTASCSTDATNAANIGSGTLPDARISTNVRRRGISFSIGVPGGTALTVAATTTDYITVPIACTISGYNLLIDAGTITVKFWKVATGTAIPTSGNSISTSGVGISTGTAIHSTTTSDFTTTTVTANDIMAMNVTAVATAAYVNGVLQCDQ